MIAELIALAAAGPSLCSGLSAPQMWTYQRAQYAHAGFPLTLRKGREAWLATAGRQTFQARRQGSRLEFRATGGAYFAGRQKGAAVDGFWIEPATSFDHARAFKMRLGQSGPRTWRGTIESHEDRLSLRAWYLPKRDDVGEFIVRNPDGLVGDTRFRATSQGCSLLLQDVNDPEHKARLKVTQSGAADLAGLTPLMPLIRLLPETKDQQQTEAHPDGWRTASPESTGMDSASFNRLFAVVDATDPRDRGVPLIHSILVARHGRLVAERYFDGYSAGRLHEMRSASKSFASLLVGAARMHGVEIGSQTPIGSELPDYRASFASDAEKAAITLGDLLGMRSGLACDDFDDASPGGEDLMQQQTRQRDWYRFFLNLPRQHGRAEHYAYCSAGTHLAAGVVAQAAGRSALDLFDSWLAAPLGIHDYSMPLDPSGRAYFGGGAHLRPRDLLKFGELLLDHGRWNGHQIVDAKWLDESTSCPANEPDCSEGLGWHFNRIAANGRTFREIEANGNGGQLLMVFPDLDLAVVFTAANFNAYPVWRKFREELMPNYILAGIRD